MKKRMKGYLFKDDGKGNYIITHEAEIGCYVICRIICKRMVKGRKTEYEEIEIIDGGKHRRCLVKRKDITVPVLISLICFYENGTRSVQWHPYTDDLLDVSLLDELGITILTYKHYYFGDKKLCDVYCPVKKDEVTPELLEKLQKRSDAAVEAYEVDKYPEPSLMPREITWNRIENSRKRNPR